MDYNFNQIEKKWQEKWEAEGSYCASDVDTGKKKSYILIEFPYPSGNGLHVGSPRSYTALDVVARKRRRQGEDVLFCMGYDSFGLPTENFAIKNNIHPAIVTEKNVANFRRQLKSIGFSFDWTREINTADPSYYKWTQWIFLKLFEHGLAYKSKMPINYCTSCRVGLANEEVVGGVCERCGAEVIRKEISQWVLRITEYAGSLLDGLDDLDYIERVKQAQRHWIGRSHGALVDFDLAGTSDKIKVFTTRPDTIYGATYMVLSPEHPLIEKYSGKITNMSAVKEYQAAAARKSDFERTELSKDKTGVKLEGVAAINPLTKQEIPIFISDYVLVTYGTGAIMAVPAHDTRDHEFAKKFNLPIVEVVKSDTDVNEQAFTDTDDGIMVNSPLIDGLPVKEAIAKITEYLQQQGIGERKTNYKLRDWIFSRQRYWGEPIPIIHCEKCGTIPIPESELPLVLPEVKDFVVGENGMSPLCNATEWVNCTCHKCGGKATRETDTMPNWAGSSWYYLRYIDPRNDKEFASFDKMQRWLPVDWYNGGMEHATLHLLYSRFWHQFLYKIGLVPTPEPYARRTAHGMILGEDGQKMSKSRGNVINPDDIVNNFGADSYRTYMCFIGAYDQTTPWSTQGLKGCHKFLQRVWDLYDIMNNEDGYSKQLESATHKMIKKVTEDIENMKFNTAVACMMSYINDVAKVGSITKGEYKALLCMLNPFAPHVTDEIWQRIGERDMLSLATWPAYDQAKTIDDIVEMPVQINGKLRERISIPNGSTEDQIKSLVLANEKVIQFIGGKEIKKFIVVQNKIINIVV